MTKKRKGGDSSDRRIPLSSSSRRKPGSSVFALPHIVESRWIPAFAGMTAKRKGGYSNDRRIPRAIPVHARRVYRPRDHFTRAGNSAHATDVGLELRARHRARWR